MERLKTFAIHLLLLITLFSFARLARADEELIIPQPLQHEGLTFDQILPDGITLESPAIDLVSFEKLEFKANLDDIDPTPKITPTLKPKPSTTPKPTITISPTSTITTTPTPKPAQALNLSNGGLSADRLFDMSNAYRADKGLPAFQKDERICSLALARAPEIGAEIAEGHMHSGKNSHNFPYWFTENIISMRTEQEAFNWWINDEIHRVQIEAANTHSCVACAGNACTQEFTSFQTR